MMIDKRQKGFSLTELLVVIVIIVVLAGFTIGALPGIQTRINRAQVEAFLEELQAGLNSYQIEYGNYPLNPEVGGVQGKDLAYRESEGLVGAGVLYTHLSGDFDGDGEVDPDEDVYVQRLGGLSNLNSKNKRTIPDPYGGNSYIIVDIYNSPIRYLAEPPRKLSGRNEVPKNTMNPTFDIWSIVDTDPSRAGEAHIQSRYVTNWSRN